MVEALIAASSGDLRRAITYLQSAARLKASENDGPANITTSDVQEIAGVVPDPVIGSFASVLGIDISDESGMDIDEKPGKGFDAIRRKVRLLMREGYSAAQLLLQVSTTFLIIFYLLMLHVCSYTTS